MDAIKLLPAPQIAGLLPAIVSTNGDGDDDDPPPSAPAAIVLPVLQHGSAIAAVATDVHENIIELNDCIRCGNTCRWHMCDRCAAEVAQELYPAGSDTLLRSRAFMMAKTGADNHLRAHDILMGEWLDHQNKAGH